MSNYSKSKAFFKANPSYLKKTGNALKTAKKALKIAKAGRQMESLSYSEDSLAMTASNAPALLYIQPPTTEGSKQTISYIEGRIFVRRNLTSAVIDTWRVDLVLDRQPAGVVLNYADLYNSDATPRPTALMDYDAQSRYKFVKSWSGAFGPQDNQFKMINFKVRSGLKVEADSRIPYQDSVNKNAYYLVWFTNAATNMPLITYDIQIVSQTA